MIKKIPKKEISYHTICVRQLYLKKKDFSLIRFVSREFRKSMLFLSFYRRAIMCRRAVRVNSQLKSHKRFADAFMTYCQLVDNARLYSTNALEGPPKVSLA